jgi:capsular polysaccharide biosynthesis protein
MELRTIWKVLRRRWWLVAVPALVALAYAAYGYVKSPPRGGFSTSIRFTAGSACDAPAKDYQDCQYYPWLTSEYVVNALTDWVKTSSFSEAVASELKTKGIDVPAAQIQGSISSDNQRSVMTLGISGGDAGQLAQIAAAAITVLQTRSKDVFPQVGTQGITVIPLDEPVIGAVPPSLSDRFNPLVRFVLGLAAGVALAFLVDYIDPTLHERNEVEKLGLQVLAEVPRHS